MSLEDVGWEFYSLQLHTTTLVQEVCSGGGRQRTCDAHNDPEVEGTVEGHVVFPQLRYFGQRVVHVVQLKALLPLGGALDTVG